MNFWQALTQRARTGLIAGVLLIAIVTAALAWWIFRTEYQVLFADLKPQDAQAMTSELERLKVPYRLGDNGNAILVDKNTVHATRIKLMGKELPLHGAVGLELFNNTDFGMTEFAQKINYQRALQGELTRTIQSLAEVREVRVLLALPEQGLFKHATSKATASITLTLRQGLALRPEQVVGVQRLVAAAVPGMAVADVTIVDSHGVALTRQEAAGTDGESTSARLDLKRDTEAYLTRKVTAVLDRSFGAGQALASVDVTLSMDQIRTTTEDVLPAASRSGLQSTGVVVRERETMRDGGGALDTRVNDTGTPRGSSAQRDVEYAVGRRVEQVVSQPGSIRRMQVVAVVRRTLEPGQEDQLRKLLAAAVGASLERGDTVVVQSLAGSPAPSQEPAVAQAAAADDAGAPPNAAQDRTGFGLLPGLGALIVIGLLAFTALRMSARSPAQERREPAALSDAERAAALQRVRDWLHERPAARAGAASAPEGPAG